MKYRWKLPVDSAEKAALTRQLNKCSSLKVLKPGKPNIAKLLAHPANRKHSGGSGDGGFSIIGLPPGAHEGTDA